MAVISNNRRIDFKNYMQSQKNSFRNPTTIHHACHFRHRTGFYCLFEQKQFERLFNELVGANPKEYARIVRFQKSLKLLQHYTEDTNLAQIAYQCGYADQSHFIREFKQFSGYTPLSLLNVCKPYSDLFNNPI